LPRELRWSGAIITSRRGAAMLPLSEEQPAARVGTKYGVMPEGLLPGPVSRLAAGITGPVDH
jgi:hypothetical protein